MLSMMSLALMMTTSQLTRRSIEKSLMTMKKALKSKDRVTSAVGKRSTKMKTTTPTQKNTLTKMKTTVSPEKDPHSKSFLQKTRRSSLRI